MTAPRKRGIFRRFWWVFVVVPLVAIAGVIGTFLFVYAHTKLPALPPGPQTTSIYDQDGTLITTLRAPIKRTIVPLSQMSPMLRDAVIAIEDKNFYHEGGVSYWGILRAAVADLRHQDLSQGGSTISQQYVKMVITGGERTFARKIREAILAEKLSHQYTKDQILEKYLNTVYFGNGAYGVQAAATTYWGKDASKLTTLQSATLAAVIRAPALYDPVRNPEAVRARRNLVLTLMAQQGYINPAEASQLQAHPVKVIQPTTPVYPHGYFIDYVSKALQGTYGQEETFTGGLRVTTTLNSADQAAAEQAIASHLPAATDPAAALVAIDPHSGAIRAMVGGKDFSKVRFNYATQARRQAGSSFKPFTLATAMEKMISLNSVWDGPSFIDIADPRCRNPDGSDWMPHNYGDETGGVMTLTQATAYSVNTIFAQLVTTVGPDQVADMAHRMGIQSDLKPVCSITLGTQAVTPLEMTVAYATLAARGVHHAPISVAAVDSALDQRLLTASTKGQRVLGQNNADVVTYALQRVIAGGTGTAAAIDRPAAGKTGTAENNADAWFCGYTPQLAACVWVGYPKNETTPMENVEGFSTVYGGSIPALIWHDFMTAAMNGQPVLGFATPNFQNYDENPPGSVVLPSPEPSPVAPPSPSPSEPPPVSPTPSPSPSPSPKPSPTPSPSPS